MSFKKDLESELFNYTSGRFLANETLRLRERSLIFNIPGLVKIIARTQRCQPEAIAGFRKLGDGSLNRAFLITLESGLQLVARIPYPLLIPKS
ncbi:uncharacterized protein FIBRA_03469 [Fibroporia radiculosa]|uniref:Aminoglycoside phosphotransferase domain-containing protein n=1 Tax=Fibroporia radiculosa TaxID=599839 RepID=J4G5K7_9APHY|nr:uncharacterized protein FIBRA_03469 [Fibroporia radiculosa]CCM01418.1 predicted protein [Fibroporia radiculosa]